MAELIGIQALPLRRVHIRNRVGDREGHFLHGRRPGFADVVAADRNGVPVRQFTFTPREDVGDDPHRVPRRVDVGAARDVFLQDVVLDGAAQLGQRDTLPACDRHIQREQNNGGGVDRHRRRHLAQRDAVKQRRHVVDGVNRHTNTAHFPCGHRMVGVVAHLRGKIEGDAQAADTLREQVAVACIGLCRRPEAGVLAHRPQAPPIHRGLNAACIREHAWIAGHCHWCDSTSPAAARLW